MWSSKVFVVMAALGLVAAMSALPTQVASAQPPGTAVVVPSTGATVSSTQVVLDATASAGVTQVKFEVTGGTLNDKVIATATLTYYGWVALWNSTNVISGTYMLQSVATVDGSSATSIGISITVSNGAPSMSFVSPPPGGGTVSGTQAVLDAVGPAGVTGVAFALIAPGCPPTGPPPQQLDICGFNATNTIYGWAAVWNSTEVPNGSYVLYVTCGQCGSPLETSTSMTVDNPTATVVLPANGSTLAGNQVLDCVPPAGYDGVQFWLTGPSLGEPLPLGNATPTYVGWLYEWDTGIENGVYGIYCTAGGPSGAEATSPTIVVNVDNPVS